LPRAWIAGRTASARLAFARWLWWGVAGRGVP